MSNLWKRLADLQGLEARIDRHNRELLDAGWSTAEIEARYPTPTFEEDFQEVCRLIEEAEREAENG